MLRSHGLTDGIRRRDLFTVFRKGSDDGSPEAPTSGAAPSPLSVRDPLRPPGALFETLFLDTCERCGRCVAVCPREAIAPLDASWGEAAGTPAIVPRDAPCVVCEGLQCTRACPTGALAKVAPFDVAMGTAVLLASCVTLEGHECGDCVVACPIPGAIAERGGRPVVDVARCTGCGVCEHVCPTEPPSIVVEPARALG